MVITALSLAVALLGVALAVTALFLNGAIKHHDSLIKDIDEYVDAQNDCEPEYYISRISCNWDDDHPYQGRLAIRRTSIQNGKLYSTCVKVFTDDDEDYNRRQAEELLEKLREK